MLSLTRFLPPGCPLVPGRWPQPSPSEMRLLSVLKVSGDVRWDTQGVRHHRATGGKSFPTVVLHTSDHSESMWVLVRPLFLTDRESPSLKLQQEFPSLNKNGYLFHGE